MNLINSLFNIRKKLVAMGILNPESIENEIDDNVCFVCNKPTKESKCESCNIDFDTIFVCPLLNDEELSKGNKVCNLTKQKCEIKGIEFESCDNYHSVDI